MRKAAASRARAARSGAGAGSKAAGLSLGSVGQALAEVAGQAQKAVVDAAEQAQKAVNGLVNGEGAHAPAQVNGTSGSASEEEEREGISQFDYVCLHSPYSKLVQKGHARFWYNVSGVFLVRFSGLQGGVTPCIGSPSPSSR